MPRPSRTAPTMVAKLSSVRTIVAASLVTSVPVTPIATPMSALRRAGASLTPSPVIATTSPRPCSARTARLYGLEIGPAILLGVVTAVGGGPIRDTLVGEVPSVLRSDLYAIPALVAAAITVVLVEARLYGLLTALGAAAVYFVIRMLGVRFGLQAPRPPGPSRAATVDSAGQPGQCGDDQRLRAGVQGGLDDRGEAGGVVGRDVLDNPPGLLGA